MASQATTVPSPGIPPGPTQGNSCPADRAIIDLQCLPDEGAHFHSRYSAPPCPDISRTSELQQNAFLPHNAHTDPLHALDQLRIFCSVHLQQHYHQGNSLVHSFS